MGCRGKKRKTLEVMEPRSKAPRHRWVSNVNIEIIEKDGRCQDGGGGKTESDAKMYSLIWI